MSSRYFQVSQRFYNISQFTVVTHKVEDRVIADFSKVVKKIFSGLDRSNDDLTNLVGLLWVFKTIVNSTLTPFDSPLLDLKTKYEQISTLLKKSGVDVFLIDTFELSATQLISKYKNNKFDRLLTVANQSDDTNDVMGIVGKIMYGNDPACINSTISSLSNYGLKFSNIESKRQFDTDSFRRIFIVSSPIRASMDLMKAVFYSGVTPIVELLLYEHETFYLPTRIEPPISESFKKYIKKFKFSRTTSEIPSSGLEEPLLNNWAEDNFWIEIHGGSRTKTAQTVPAYYILFDGGEGAFMPTKGKVLHIIKSERSGAHIFSYDLTHVDILDLTEGDYVLLRKNSSGFLFNENIDGIYNEEDDDGVLDDITDWKNALGALLLTKGYSEIAQLMQSKGVTISSSQIKHWVGSDVIAPNSELEFKALISVLGDENKLSGSIEDVNKYSANKWASIRQYRVSRQKAGNKARQSILDSLLSKVEGIDLGSPDAAKNLNLEHGQNILIRRIASIDQSISYVNQSNLYRIDDLRGNKWLR